MDSQRWKNLIAYYRACVSVENTTDALFTLANNGSEFVHVTDEERRAAGKGVLTFDDGGEAFRAFMQAGRWEQTPAVYLYGFPCRADGPNIFPVFIFDLEEVASETGRAFEVQSGHPRINVAGLGRLLQEERKSAAVALSECWDNDKPLDANVDAALQELEMILPGLDRDALLRSPSGTFFRAVGSTYTRGLEQELAKLENSSANRIWSLILDRNDEPAEADNQEILEVTPLNDEQRSAIKSAFVNPLTVVTGPPGTGKSQIVINIIANSVSRNETVLFASKNRKAVDVVIERLSAMQSAPVILKYRDQQSAFTDTLLQTIERASLINDDALDREIEEYAKDLERIRGEARQSELTLDRIVDRRNRIQEIEIELESLKEELPAHIATHLNHYDAIQLGPIERRLAGLERAIADMERPNLVVRVCSLVGQSTGKRLQKAASSLLNELPSFCKGLSAASLEECKALADLGRKLERWSDGQRELLDLMDRNWNEPRLETLRDRIANSQKRAVPIGVKLVDALVNRRLKNLTLDQRRAVGDYAVHARALRERYTGDNLQQELRQANESAFRRGIAKTFPALAVTNLSVRHAVPLAADVVDLVVIDEASQCDIASALPLLYRAKRAMVIGDSNQLQHISNLGPDDDHRLRHNAGLNAVDDLRLTYSTYSLFDIVRSVASARAARFVHLKEHFRSRAEIIEFSNRQFYGNSMTVLTDYQHRPLATSGEPIKWRNVRGDVKRFAGASAFNETEARAVVDLVREIAGGTAGQPELRPSLGVVTPFRPQANRIRELTEQSIGEADLQRLEFTVSTAHGFQGDEKDIMIFSPVISQNTPASAARFIGRTPNLFNVAITRARSELHIVGDMAAVKNSDISFLSQFVEYVESLRANRPPDSVQEPFQSVWEELLYDALKSAGIITLPQYRFDQYKLNLAVPEHMVDIEIDGEHWHRNLDGSRVASDLKRDTRLTSRGWRVKRFWVYELQSDMARCVREIEELLAT